MTEGERADADFQVVLETPDEAAVRDELHHLVLADLHGPLGGETEEFGSERPTDRYIVGRLAPDGTVIEPDTQDESADTDGADLGEDHPEPSAPNIVSLAPSAMGCTAYVAGDTKELSVRAEWAWYQRTAPEAESEQSRVWQRVPVHGSATVTLTEGGLGPEQLNAEYPQVVLRGRARRHDGNWLVSLFLVNAQPRPSTATGHGVAVPGRAARDRAGAATGVPAAAGHDQRRRPGRQRGTAPPGDGLPASARSSRSGTAPASTSSAPTATRCARWRSAPDGRAVVRDPVHRRARRRAPTTDLPGLADLVLDMKELGRANRPDLLGRTDPAGRRLPGLDRAGRKRSARATRPATSPATRRRGRRVWPRPGAPPTGSRPASSFWRPTNPRWRRSGSPTGPCTCSACTSRPPRHAPGTQEPHPG